MENNNILESERFRLSKESWKAFRENAGAMISLFLILYLPIDVIIYSIYFLTYGPSKEIEITFSIPLIFILLVGLLYLSLFGTLIRIAMIYIINQSHTSGNKVTVVEALDFSRNRWLDGIKTTLLKGIFLLPLYLAFIIPGLVFSYYWSLSLQSVALRSKYCKDAMNHSRKLLKGHFSKVLHILLPVIIIVMILSWLDNILLMSLENIGVQVPFLWGNLMGSVLSQTGGVMILISLTILFIGIDLQSMNSTLEKQNS